MSAPAVKRTDYDAPAEAELARWPGVSWSRVVRAKHFALVLEFRGVSRFVIYPASGSDRRGVLNHVSDIRRVLVEMGATRLEVVKSEGPRRQRNRTEPKMPVGVLEKATGGPLRDPWAALRGLSIPKRQPEPLGLWRRLLAGVMDDPVLAAAWKARSAGVEVLEQVT